MPNDTCTQPGCANDAAPNTPICRKHTRIARAIRLDLHCAVEGCKRLDLVGTMCISHYHSLRPRPECSIEGCPAPRTNSVAPYCKKHQRRLERHGSPDRTAWRMRGLSVETANYRNLIDRRHPLAPSSGRVPAHRAILFAEIGWGPHPCHWCGKQLSWKPADGCLPLEVDHLNAQRDDNRLDNIVPSCHRCNTTRGQQELAHRRRDLGWWSRNDTIAATRAAPIPIPSEFQ